MPDAVTRARELCSVYKAAHLPPEMAVVQFAFEFPRVDFDVLRVSEALGVDASAFDYIYDLLGTPRERQAELLDNSKSQSQKKHDKFAEDTKKSEDAFYARFGSFEGNRARDNFSKFSKATNGEKQGSTSTFTSPPVAKPSHHGKPWRNAPAHLIDHCAVLELAWPIDMASLKKTYRNIALDTHPDKNPDDTAKLAKFKAATEAYERLETYLGNLK